jgi:hypothetical protein
MMQVRERNCLPEQAQEQDFCIGSLICKNSRGFDFLLCWASKPVTPYRWQADLAVVLG